jgi:hypothetical protein
MLAQYLRRRWPILDLAGGDIGDQLPAWFGFARTPAAYEL